MQHQGLLLMVTAAEIAVLLCSALAEQSVVVSSTPKHSVKCQVLQLLCRMPL